MCGFARSRLPENSLKSQNLSYGCSLAREKPRFRHRDCGWLVAGRRNTEGGILASASDAHPLGQQTVDTSIFVEA